MLKELIDKFYLDQQGHRDQIKFYVTDAGKCQRSVFFKLKSVPREKIDARIMRIFEQGEQLHRHIFNVLYKLRIGVTTEISIPPQKMVSGRADAILCLNGENYVLDIKSMNSMIFRKLTTPKPENIYQMQLYLHFFDIKKGILLYIDKDRQELKEFVVDYDKKLVETLLDGFKELKVKIEKDIVPGVLVDYPKNWQCRYCAFRTVCDSAGRDEVKWLDFKKKIGEVE